MTDRTEREQLVELAAAAWRPRDPHGAVLAHPAWADLDDSGRVEAYQAARHDRGVESALDPQGLSTTAKAVLARILRR